MGEQTPADGEVRVSVSVGGFVSGRRGGCCRGRTWSWIEAHALRFTMSRREFEERAAREFVSRDVALALSRIAVSDAQGRSGGGISLTPGDVPWLESPRKSLLRLRLLAPDPGSRVQAHLCSGDAFPWNRAHVVSGDKDQPLGALIGRDAASVDITAKVTILPEDQASI